MACGIGIIALIVIIVVVVILTTHTADQSNHNISGISFHSDEGYEPTNMGSRKYWGFGREYGYWLDDTGHLDKYCHQRHSNDVCPPGYDSYKDSLTGRLDCCVKPFNY